MIIYKLKFVIVMKRIKNLLRKAFQIYYNGFDKLYGSAIKAGLHPCI